MSGMMKTLIVMGKVTQNMKPITHLVIFSIALLSCADYKSKVNAAGLSSSSTTQRPTTTTVPTSSITPTATDSYRLVVEFYSIGQGIDGNANDAFVKFLNAYRPKLTYTPTHWGREGEVDYCLTLSALSRGEQGEFVKKAKAILRKSRLVHFSEHSKCVHKH